MSESKARAVSAPVAPYTASPESGFVPNVQASIALALSGTDTQSPTDTVPALLAHACGVAGAADPITGPNEGPGYAFTPCTDQAWVTWATSIVDGLVPFVHAAAVGVAVHESNMARVADWTLYPLPSIGTDSPAKLISPSASQCDPHPPASMIVAEEKPPGPPAFVYGVSFCPTIESMNVGSMSTGNTRAGSFSHDGSTVTASTQPPAACLASP